jgi:hypothetical protein
MHCSLFKELYYGFRSTRVDGEDCVDKGKKKEGVSFTQ